MIEDFLRKSLGKRLTNVVGDFHVFEVCASATPNSVWLGFEGMPRYHLRGASDGWHLIVDEASPEEFDMQESGATRLRDMANQEPFPRIFNQCLRRAWTISSPGLADTFGVRLDFESGTVRVLNWGDDMYIGENFPSEVGAHEIAEIPV